MNRQVARLSKVESVATARPTSTLESRATFMAPMRVLDWRSKLPMNPLLHDAPAFVAHAFDDQLLSHMRQKLVMGVGQPEQARVDGADALSRDVGDQS